MNTKPSDSHLKTTMSTGATMRLTVQQERSCGTVGVFSIQAYRRSPPWLPMEYSHRDSTQSQMFGKQVGVKATATNAAMAKTKFCARTDITCRWADGARIAILILSTNIPSTTAPAPTKHDGLRTLADQGADPRICHLGCEAVGGGAKAVDQPPVDRGPRCTGAKLFDIGEAFKTLVSWRCCGIAEAMGHGDQR